MKKQDVEVQEQVRNGTDYSQYDMSVLEFIIYAVLAGAVLFCVGYVFYKSVVLSVLLSLVGIFYPKIRKAQIIENRQKKLNLQFKDMLYSLSSAIGAGYSVEKSLEITLNDMRQQYNDPKAFIIKELELMVTRVKMNRTIEEIFADFAERSHVEDIQTFANIFEISKRTGGNLIDIIRSTTQIISDKIEISTEIETLIAGQKMEQKVLTVLPVGLVFFMTKTSGSFMDPLFNTLAGRIVCTGALAVILLATLWSNKISNIKI